MAWRRSWPTPRSPRPASTLRKRRRERAATAGGAAEHVRRRLERRPHGAPDRGPAELHDVTPTRQPGGTELGWHVRRLLLDGRQDTPSDRAEALLYAADRAHHVQTVIRPSIARGAAVICDRYVDSFTAYQAAAAACPRPTCGGSTNSPPTAWSRT
ncbi:dTMP kinase [Micromonospora sp. NPDC005652]|uniref:dTMP kinase n=1 Tax=Micromonospora sp. NPDC005652 TaxID=3157046 RepID=UPI0033E392B1